MGFWSKAKRVEADLLAEADLIAREAVSWLHDTTVQLEHAIGLLEEDVIPQAQAQVKRLLDRIALAERFATEHKAALESLLQLAGAAAAKEVTV